LERKIVPVFGFTFLSSFAVLSRATRKRTQQAKFVVGLIKVFSAQELGAFQVLVVQHSVLLAAGNCVCKL
jgi:hypothetical protein